MDAVPSRTWIFQAAPEHYDLATRLRPGAEDEWEVDADLGDGDAVYLWQTGSEEALWGWATSGGAAAADVVASSAAPPRRAVALRYEVRFEPPLRGDELRREQRLAGLPPLKGAPGGAFLLPPELAAELGGFVRARGLEAPPAPGVEEGPSDWALRLSPAGLEVLAWARAAEGSNPRVGTRGLLVGLQRPTLGEVAQLLDRAGAEPGELADALRQVRPEVPLDPDVHAPAPLSTMPYVTDNLLRVLERASALAPQVIEPRHLFGALLEHPEARATQALARVLEGRLDFELVRAGYPDYLAGPLGVSYGDFLRERLARTLPSTAITTDTWTDSDQLEHELYADAIARFILNGRTRAPLTIGIKAPWGAGKTSLMRMIRRKLDPQATVRPREPEGERRLTIREFLRTTRSRTPAEAAVALQHDVRKGTTTIWFNAWKYQSGEQLWAGLAHAILSQVGERMSPLDRDRLWASIQVRRLRLPELRRGFYRYVAGRLLPYAVVVPLAAAGVAAAAVLDRGLLAGATVGGAILSVVLVGAGLVRSVGDEVTKAVPQLVEEPDYESRLGFLHLVDSDMHRILEVAGASAENPFVIFVDDLDRCSYTTVAQVIEALNVFLAGDFDNCIFVIAMEPDLVAAQIHIAYEKLFERLGEPGNGDLGWRFLEKMVQLPLALPEPGRAQVDRFLDSILAETRVAVDAVADDDPRVLEAQQAIRRESRTRSLEEIPEALARVREQQAPGGGEAAPELEAVLEKAARREFEDVFSDAHAVEMVKRYAAELSGNPREIKRFVNVFRFYAYVDFWRSFRGLETPGLEGAAKLARLAIGWPSLLNVLARDVTHDGESLPLLAHLERVNGDDRGWQACIALAPERNRLLLGRGELRRVIAQEPHVGTRALGFL